MHVYIYDSYVNQKKYDKIVARIETRITDLGLNGKIVRIGMLNSVYDIIHNEVKKGAKTIVVVGNNHILHQAINSLATLTNKNIPSNIPLGMIPIGEKENHISKYLGIKNNDDATNIISARRIETIDLGKINDHYFLTQAVVPTIGTTVSIDKDFSIEINDTGEIYIINMPIDIEIPSEINPKTNDDVLELFIKTSKTNKFLTKKKNNHQQSIFSFKELTIINKKFPINIDTSQTISSPAIIKIAKEKINLIVGKNRKF